MTAPAPTQNYGRAIVLAIVLLIVVVMVIAGQAEQERSSDKAVREVKCSIYRPNDPFC